MPVATSSNIIIRMDIQKAKISFGEVAVAIGNAGGDIIATDIIHSGQESAIRDITVNVPDHSNTELLKRIRDLNGVKVINVSDRTFLVHLGGKIEMQPKMPIKNREDLSHVYTPGVAKVCKAIHEDSSKAYSLTIKRNTVAVVSDGTAVLGLGDIGPFAAMPVMEGKAMLFKQLAGVDAVPICLDTKDTEEIIRTIKNIAPGFGGINLEDISSPRCFEIEERLKQELDIPVFHDDQHGTAVVVLAGLLNALKIVGKTPETIKVVVAGIGAAGVSCSKMLLAAGVKNLIPVDRQGALVAGESYPNSMWNWLAERSNPYNIKGSLSEVLEGADVFIGVSGPGILKVDDLKKMARDPIVFAMANPEPEIDPESAEPYVRVMASGRSDYPNQINNVLCFPGIFRGALECRASTINEKMKLAAAEAIASVVSTEELNEQYIIPSVFNEDVVKKVRAAVIKAAIETQVARRVPRDFR
ncbi:malate dehydrogenase [Cohnella kolymensis]|uniref:Malate dehydrogenase n=2 Tax=Cohnella kolymensis TaxID=1590652 RepID=A0ABR5A5V9_9BACL|nr:malate dehydrogenase [Cohnella kolymensis]